MILVAVCGGRDYTNASVVDAVLLGEVPPGAVIVHGDARGADTLADYWAVRTGHDVIRVPALWTAFGKAAGMRRNGIIAGLPLAKLVAFPGGVGTAGMVRMAKSRGIPVVEVP